MGTNYYVALVATPWSLQGPGNELIEAGYARTAVPLPLDNGMLPNLSITAAKNWPVVVGWQVWDDPVAGNYLYGADLLWPMGPRGVFTLTFDASGIATQLDPNADVVVQQDPETE